MTLRVGLIGTSWWADAMYLPALANHPDGRITAICGRDPGRTRERAELWGIARWTTDWRSMIESEDLDAVIVASGNDSHYEIASAAISRGLHLLCEKPITRTVAEATELADRAETAGLITMVPFTYRWMPTNLWIKQLIDNGYVGTPRHVNMRYYAGYARDGGYAWRFDRQLAGAGVVGDLGSHWLHLARWWLGEVTEIGAVTTNFVDRPARPDGSSYEQAEDSALITVRFASGAYGSLQVSAVCWEGTPFGQTHHVEIHGTDGTLYSHNDWDTVQEVRGVKAGAPGPAAALAMPDELWGTLRRSPVGDTYRDVFRTTEAMSRGWVSAIAGGETSEPDLREGERVQVLVEAAIASAAEGGRMLPV